MASRLLLLFHTACRAALPPGCHSAPSRLQGSTGASHSTGGGRLSALHSLRCIAADVQCRLRRVFEEGNPAAVVTSGLMTVSQLVRMSRENYRPLGEANVYSIVRRLLGHRDAQVRARACNLVGNMCRWVGTCGRLHARLLPVTWCAASAGHYPCWTACHHLQLPCVQGAFSR